MLDKVAVIIVSGGSVIETVFGRQVASQRHGAQFVCAEHHCGRPDKLAVLVHRKPVVLHFLLCTQLTPRPLNPCFLRPTAKLSTRALAQCDISIGAVTWSRRSRLTPPMIASRSCEW